MTYIHNYTSKTIQEIVLVFVLLCTTLSLVWAQPKDNLLADDSNPYINANTPSKQVKKQPASTSGFSPLFRPHEDIVKTTLIAPTKLELFAPQKIERKFYVNNIFDIDESDNPFALLSERSQQKTQQQKNTGLNFSSNVKKLFSAENLQSSKQSNWLFLVLLGIVAFMAVILSAYKSSVTKTFQAFVNATAAGNLHREQHMPFSASNIANHSLFAFTMGSFAYLATQQLAPNIALNSFAAYALFVLGVGGLYLAKNIQLQLIGQVLPYQPELNFYSFLIANHNKVLAFGLIPSLFLLAYAPPALQNITLYASIFSIGLMYLYRCVRTLTAVSDVIIFHKFHFFVYLCTDEIAPIVILLKLLSIL
ncbi:MAG: DUF4271 domain-containing protein [Aureispira sp.]|nr:DUF4271 domain-containing protein [Aureispira sp.]